MTAGRRPLAVARSRRLSVSLVDHVILRYALRCEPMSIDVEILDERGNTISRYNGPALGLPFTSLASADSACMRFISPWCDVTFNEAQIEVLKGELAVAARRTEDPRRLSELDALSSFVERATGVHVYLKFIGD